MLTLSPSRKRRQGGVMMLEILMTLVILAFGLLGVAGLLMKMHVAEVESFQRAQAVLVLRDMAERINANRPSAPSYVTGASSPLGTGDTQPGSCTALAFGAARDQCEWSNALKGAAESKAGVNVGAMLGARGCIEQLQAANPASGVCTPGIYRVTVVWQGLNSTAASSYACGNGLYGAANLRRAVSADLTIGLPRC